MKQTLSTTKDGTQKGAGVAVCAAGVFDTYANNKFTNTFATNSFIFSPRIRVQINSYKFNKNGSTHIFAKNKFTNNFTATFY